MNIKTLAVAAALSVFAVARPGYCDDISPDYLKGVRTQIIKHVVYPRLAKMREQEGTVAYVVTVDAGGTVADAAIETSSGNPTLDTAAIDAIKEAAPFPAPPTGKAQVHGAIAYKLD